jgi:hypothetical protein
MGCDAWEDVAQREVCCGLGLFDSWMMMMMMMMLMMMLMMMMSEGVKE